MNNTIAVISDIHANLSALRQAMQLIDKEQVDSIFCCGDIVGYGDEPNECCELIRSLDCSVVAGNHDFAVIGKTEYRLKFSKQAIRAIEKSIPIMSTENLSWLGSLPLIHRDDELTFTHASLHFPKKWPYMTIEKCSQSGPYQDVRESFDRLTGSTCFIGHSHVPALFLEKANGEIEEVQPDTYPYKLQGRVIIDVGSVGKTRILGNEGSLVIFDRKERMIQFRKFSFDSHG